jgi:uncharacterized OB-fold protein
VIEDRVHYVGESSLGISIVIEDENGQPALAASRCPECADVRVPPRSLCPMDRTPADVIAVTGAGTIYEAVELSMAPPGFDVPFWVGYVDLVEGARVFAQIERDEGQVDPAHGDEVRLEIKQVNAGDNPVFGPVFRRVNHDAAH